MPNNTENTLNAAIRSMETVVIPAMNTENPLALEQANIITQLLRFLRERIPYAQQRDRLELKIYADMVDELLEDITVLLPDHIENTQKIMKEAGWALNTPTPDPSSLGLLAEELRSTLSHLARSCHDRDEQQRWRIESVIVRGSKQVTDLHRAWLAPTGMVQDSDKIPDLDSQLQMK